MIRFCLTENRSSLLLLVLCVLLFSCKSMRKFQEDTYNARDKDKQSFVKTIDGKVIEANEAVLRAPLFGKATIELDKETRIPVKDVVAYQNRSAYFHRIGGQFAPRIKHGPINMFHTTETYQEYQGPSMGNSRGGWRTRTRTIYYLQKGDEGAIKTFSPDVTREFVSDYAPAMEYMDLYDHTQKKVKTWSLINTSAVIAGFVLAATGVKNDQVNAAGYAGTGLVLGGLVNGFVNKVRRAKNVKNLELAIDTYNSQRPKKNK